METKAIVLQPLGGIDQRWAKDQRHANRVEDMTWDGPKGAWTTAGGFRRLIVGENIDPFAGIGVVSSLFSFTQHNGARAWIIYEAQNGNLYEFNPSNAARTGSPGDVGRDRGYNLLNDRAYLSTPWQRSQACTFGDNFYIVNGINRPMVFTGYYWDYAGFSSPAGTPSVSNLTSPHASTGDNLVGTRMNYIGLGPVSNIPVPDAPNYVVGYRWRVQNVNNRAIRSPVSAPSDLITVTNVGGVGGGGSSAWVGVPTGGPETVARIVWRTQNVYDSNGDPVQGYADQFFFHSIILDNMVTGFQDFLTDAELGAQLVESEYGTWPTSSKYIAPFKGTMFAAGVNEAALYYSAPLQPENFPPDNVLDLGDANLGPITGLYPTRNALVVFKQRGIQLIKGDPVNGFFPQILTRDVGCAAPNTVRDVPGVGLCFLSESGIYAMQGALENEGVPTRVVPLHVPMGEWVPRLNRAALIGACGAVYHRDKEYWLCVPTIGSDTNNLVLVYHYEAGEWSTRTGFPVSCITETNDHRGNLVFGSWNTTDSEGLMLYSRGWPDKGGVDEIAALYQTGWIDAGGVYRTIAPKGVEVRCGLHGNNEMNLAVITNRRNDEWPEQPAMAAQYPEDQQPVFGTATYDSGMLWQALRPGTLRWDINGPQYAAVHEVAYTFTPTNHWLTVAGVAAELSAEGVSMWKPITAQTKAGR